MDVSLQPTVRAFFHPDSGTFSYVVHAAEGGGAAIIDPVLDYDAASACTATHSVDAIVDYVRARRLCVRWILDTHAHACLLYTSDAADDLLCVDLGGRR